MVSLAHVTSGLVERLEKAVEADMDVSLSLVPQQQCIYSFGSDLREP
jgi:hypothetical protein